MRAESVRRWAACGLLATGLCGSWLWPLSSGSEALDFRYFEFLFEAFRSEVLLYREFPSWNPYACGGYPLHANPQTPFLSPLAWPSLVLGAVAGLKVFAWAHLVIALAGAHRLGREAGLSGPAPWLLALAFAGSARFAWVLQGGQFSMLTYAFLPWLLAFLIRALSAWRYAAWAGAILALMVLEGGTSGVPIGLVLLAAFAAAACLARGFDPRPIGVLAVTLVVGGLLSLPKSWPVLSYLADHPRPVASQDDALNLAQVARMFLHRRVTPFMIDPASEPALAGLQYRWWGEYGAYLGVVVPALAVVGLVVRFRTTWTWSAMMALFFLIMLGQHGPAWPYEWLRHLPMYRDLRVPSRYAILVVLMIAILAAYGLHAMRERASTMTGGWRGMRVLPWVLLVLAGTDIVAFFHQVVGTIGKRPAPTEVARAGSLTPVGPAGTDLAGAVRRGLASLDCYDPMFERTRYRSPVHDRLNRMSSVVEVPASSRAHLTLVEWTPNRIEFLAETPRETTVLVRQNSERGWTSDAGEVRDEQGVLAVRLPRGRHLVSLHHRSRGVIEGVILSGLTVVVWTAFGLWRRKKPSTGSPTATRSTPSG